MLGVEELKGNIGITKTTIECPVKGCNEKNREAEKKF
jgi:hypothetical protein